GYWQWKRETCGKLSSRKASQSFLVITRVDADSLMQFAYIVLCMYQIFTDYMPSDAASLATSASSTAEFPPFPPIVMASYTTLVQILSSLPSTIHSAFNFAAAALATITPSVII